MIAVFWLMLSTLCGPAAAQQPPPPGEVVAELLAHEAELLAAVREHDPQEHARMLRLRETDRGAYVVALFRASRTIDRARTDPEGAARRQAIRDKEQAVRRLARGYAALAPDEQAARREQIEAMALELFELKQTERRIRVEELRARLEALTREIEARETGREALVREYVEQLLVAPVDL